MARRFLQTHRRGTRIRVSERGAELVEFAFVLPLLLFVLAGIIDFGLLMQRYEVVTNAAREGARIASLPGYNQADVQARVTQYVQNGISTTATANATLSGPTTITPTGGGAPYQVRTVTVTHTSNFLILGPIARLIAGGGTYNSLTLTAQSTMRLEVPGP